MTSPALDPVREVDLALARLRDWLDDEESWSRRDVETLARHVLAREEKYRAVVEAARQVSRMAADHVIHLDPQPEHEPEGDCSGCFTIRSLREALAALDQHKGGMRNE